MNEEKEITRLFPSWRKFCLAAHHKFMMVVEFVMSPFSKTMEELDGTATWKNLEKRLNENK